MFTRLHGIIFHQVNSLLFTKKQKQKTYYKNKIAARFLYNILLQKIRNISLQITTPFFTENFPLLMILTGVIGGVIVIIAIAMVIILCQRREKKPEGKEGATAMNSPLTNIISNYQIIIHRWRDFGWKPFYSVKE